jgi:SNF2 family DNA or RNA helicase
MALKWIVDDNHIALERDGVLEQLSAALLWEHLSDSFPQDEDYSGIKFSELSAAKIGTPMKAELLHEQDSNTIIFSLFAIRQGTRIPIDIRDNFIVDHGVHNNTIFYINGPIDDMSEVLQTVQISNSGNITLHQYLQLVNICKERNLDLIEDNVEFAQLDKSLIATNVEPKHITATLYPYQKTGYAWLKYMTDERCGCILGDEMGLGKTLQVISLFSDIVYSMKNPMLVIAPVSLLENWKREIRKFAPEIKEYIHHGGNRTGRYQELQNYNVIIISYNTAVSDLSMLRMIDWAVVCIDEAQNIKNPASERAKSVKMIPREMSIAVSGTPFENHVTDIWSIVDFVFPSYFGTLSSFNSFVSDDVNGARLIEPMLSPLMIRRLVKDVAKDLPEKVVIPTAIIMSDAESILYEQIRQEAISQTDSSNPVLGALQKLRMFCAHPQITNPELSDNPMKLSVKYERLCEVLDEIISSNEKVLIFTSYIRMFEIFLNDLPSRYGVSVLAINGETPVAERQNLVDTFSTTCGAAIFILNPRAAGIGLNITAANHVIHYNLEWNPALEDQSSARAFRRGQNKTVFIHRLFYANSIEQIINERIERKREISDVAVIGTSGEQENREDIVNALLLSPLI